MTGIVLSLGQEKGAWLGLASGSVAALLGAGAAVQSHGLYAAFGPQDLTAWVTAICSSIGAIAAAANGLAIVVHKLGKAPRTRKRKPRHDHPDLPAAPPAAPPAR
jgi:hypothetical protein